MRNLSMMKDAGDILFMQFDCVTARTTRLQTRMKRQSLQWRVCLMRHALGLLNVQLSSLRAVFCAQGGQCRMLLAAGSGPSGWDTVSPFPM